MNSLAMIFSLGACNTYVSVGAHAISDDASEWMFVETRSQDVIVYPPLQGWRGRGNYRFRLWVGESLDSADVYSDFYKGHAMDIYDMSSKGYAVLNYLQQPAELRGGIVIDTSGEELLRDSNEDFGMDRAAFRMIPSPNGEIIAAVSYDTDWSTYQSGSISQHDIAIRFYDANTLDIAFEDQFTQTLGVINNVAWFDDESILLIDQGNTALQVYLDGSHTSLILDNCTYLPTSSGPYHEATSTKIKVNSNKDGLEIDHSYQLPQELCD